MTSSKLEENPDKPINPDWLLRILLTSSGDFPCLTNSSTISASISPQRVDMTNPGRGEYPMEVSKDFPSFTATTLEPPVPRWHIISLSEARGFFKRPAVFAETYW